MKSVLKCVGLGGVSAEKTVLTVFVRQPFTEVLSQVKRCFSVRLVC